MSIQTFFQSKKFKWLLAGIGALIVLLLVFQLGIFIGLRKARFSYGWGENYHRAFGGPKGGWLADFEGKDFISGAGTAGTVIKIDGNNVIVKGQDGVEKIIVLNDNTTIKKDGKDIKAGDLKVDNRVVIIGAPQDDGSIQAKIIRVFAGNNASSTPPVGPPPGPPPGPGWFNFPHR